MFFSFFVFCFLFCVFYVFVLFCVLFLSMHMVVYFLSVYNITDYCHRMETHFEILNIISFPPLEGPDAVVYALL